MKKIVRNKSRLCTMLVTLFAFLACDMDFENKGAINPENVWKDRNMISAFLTDIYALPGWPGGGSDECIDSKGANMSDYLRGIISVENNGIELNNYDNINKVNFFLENLETVPSTILSDIEKNQMKAQALFWRAWQYWSKVSLVGGVPLILEFPDIKDKESLFVPRNKTSECVAQIIRDLDNAIESLPDKWDNDNYGRIDKGAAMAFKGRVLLWYASPLFNPQNDKTRWDEAYKANSTAVDFLEKQGKDLFPNYKELWYSEQNQEVIMLNQYYYPDHTFSQAGMRPEPLTQGSSNYSQPIYPLLSAFPLKDGSSLVLDKNRLKSDPAYNSQYFTEFLMNRDDRFYTTVFVGGTTYPCTDDHIRPGEKYWNVFQKIKDDSPKGFSYVSLVAVQLQQSVNFGSSGYFLLKGLDKDLNLKTVGEAKTDWVEIRFAEVLMNYGECANETGKKDEALAVLKRIRKRAGILAGNNGMHGITAVAENEIREAYILERFVEFAFEGKRWGDLRRWKRFDILNNQKYRSGLYITLNDDKSIISRSDFEWTSSITDKAIRDKYFHLEYIENLDGEAEYQYNLDLNHWFYPINRKDLEMNSKLEQNNEWGGSFNPLL